MEREKEPEPTDCTKLCQDALQDFLSGNFSAENGLLHKLELLEVEKQITIRGQLRKEEREFKEATDEKTFNLKFHMADDDEEMESKAQTKQESIKIVSEE